MIYYTITKIQNSKKGGEGRFKNQDYSRDLAWQLL